MIFKAFSMKIENKSKNKKGETDFQQTLKLRIASNACVAHTPRMAAAFVCTLYWVSSAQVNCLKNWTQSIYKGRHRHQRTLCQGIGLLQLLFLSPLLLPRKGNTLTHLAYIHASSVCSHNKREREGERESECVCMSAHWTGHLISTIKRISLPTFERAY